MPLSAKSTPVSSLLGNVTVSIIIPCYNSGIYLRESVESIIRQSFINWTLFIVDDCSTDACTKEIIGSLGQRDSRIHVFSTQVNSGAGVARNVGLDNVRGGYVAFCDADDWWYPNKLEDQLIFMISNGYEFSCTYYENCDEQLNVLSTVRQASRQGFRRLISGCNIGTPGVVYKFNGAEDLRFPNCRRGEDWAMWLRLLKRFSYVYVLPKVEWKYRHVPGSTNSNKIRIVSAVIDMYMQELRCSKLSAILLFTFVFMPRYLWRSYKARIKTRVD